MAVTRSSRIVAGNTTFLNDVTIDGYLTSYPGIYDPETANVSIYVDAAGNDTTGDGSIGSPYLTIARAFRDIPVRCEHQRTLYLSAGTFQFPDNWTNAFVANGHYIIGTTSTEASHEISGIGTSSRDNGLILTVTGAPGWTDGEHVGRIIQFTSGGLNNQYGVIYRNTADTIYVTNSKTGAWTNPVITDTFNLVSLDTTINNNVTSPDRIGVQFDYLVFQDLNVTGGYTGVGYTTIAYLRCNLNVEQAAIGAFSRGVYWTSYISEDNTLSSVVVAGDSCRFELDYGTVVNGQNRVGIDLLYSAVMTIGYDCVFANLDSGGITLSGHNGIHKNQVSSNLTLRFYDCAAGFEQASTVDDLDIHLPYIAGNITGNFLANLQGKKASFSIDGGTVTTATGDNACTIDGTNEGYLNSEVGTRIIDIETSGAIDGYLQTSDATATDIVALAVAEGDLYKVTAEVTGKKSDYSERAVYHLEGLFYRNTGGNVTQEGGTTNVMTIESDNTWDCTLNADTGNQTIDVRVTGVAGTTIDWKAVVKYILLE